MAITAACTEGHKFVRKHSSIGQNHHDFKVRGLTGSFIHRELIGQDSSDLTESWHLNAIFLQFASHVTDLFLWKTWKTVVLRSGWKQMNEWTICKQEMMNMIQPEGTFLTNDAEWWRASSQYTSCKMLELMAYVTYLCYVFSNESCLPERKWKLLRMCVVLKTVWSFKHRHIIVKPDMLHSTYIKSVVFSNLCFHQND